MKPLTEVPRLSRKAMEQQMIFRKLLSIFSSSQTMSMPEKQNSARKVLKPDMKIIQITFVGKPIFYYNLELILSMEVKRLMEVILQNSRGSSDSLLLCRLRTFEIFFHHKQRLCQSKLTLLSKQKLKILTDNDLYMTFSFTAISKISILVYKADDKNNRHSLKLTHFPSKYCFW